MNLENIASINKDFCQNLHCKQATDIMFLCLLFFFGCWKGKMTYLIVAFFIKYIFQDALQFLLHALKFTLHGTNTKQSHEAKSRGIKIIPSWAPAVQLLRRPVLQADTLLHTLVWLSGAKKDFVSQETRDKRAIFFINLLSTQ